MNVTSERSTSVDLPDARQSLSVFARVLRYRMSNSPESLTSTGCSSRCADSNIVESFFITGEVVAVSLKRPQGRELYRQPRSKELEDPLWPEEIFEAILS
jgi:hypothetical protein